MTALDKAKAKLVKNSKLNTVKLIVAFNVYEQNRRGNWLFPRQQKCAYVSGDLVDGNDVLRVLKQAEQILGTEIVLV